MKHCKQNITRRCNVQRKENHNAQYAEGYIVQGGYLHKNILRRQDQDAATHLLLVSSLYYIRCKRSKGLLWGGVFDG